MICVDCKNNPEVPNGTNIAMRKMMIHLSEDGKKIGHGVVISQCDRCKRIDVETEK